ncbi:MAG: tetratricopeptide repeat protein [Deltaproteobacteria bacterium]
MEINALLEKGIEHAEHGRFKEALQIFDEDLFFAFHPVAMSYYAVCLARLDNAHERAVSLCLIALEREPCNPDIYLNLGRILLERGDKPYAIKAFKRGLDINDGHAGLKKEFRRLGVRKSPVISFLPRTHCLNRILGSMRHIMLSAPHRVLIHVNTLI